MNWRSWVFATALGIFSATAVQAQETPEIESRPEDLGYGDYDLAEDARFPDITRLMGRTDRRGELNPVADRAIMWSTGYIPSKGTIQFQNLMVLGQRLAYSATDRLQLFGQAYLPFTPQTYLAAGGQFHVADGDAWKLALGAQLRHRRTNLVPGTNDTGLGLHAVFDIIASDNLTWNLGISAHIPLRHMVENVDTATCSSRREIAEGTCVQTEPVSRLMPTSGYWVAAYAGLNYFVTDWLLINAEFFTGASQGNFWALDSVVNYLFRPESLSYGAERQLLESTEWSAGLGPIGPINLGVGTTWIYQRIAIGGSLMLMSLGGEGQLVPFITIGLNLGG